MTNTERSYFTVADLALLLDVPGSTLRAWVRRGAAPDSYRVGREIRFPINSTQTWCRERGIPLPDARRCLYLSGA